MMPCPASSQPIAALSAREGLIRLMVSVLIRCVLALGLVLLTPSRFLVQCSSCNHGRLLARQLTKSFVQVVDVDHAPESAVLLEHDGSHDLVSPSHARMNSASCP